MDIFVTGGSGFVGKALSRRFLDAGHRVTAVGTRPVFDAIRHDAFRYLAADTSRPGDWQDAAADADAIVNLAGKTIFKRWSRRYKAAVYDSRILTTRHLVDALPAPSRAVLVSTSAVGYYGNRGDDIVDENDGPGTDFLAKVGTDWESAANGAAAKGARVVLARFGVVLGRDGGAMEKMIPAFRSGLGGPIGTGRQWFPWVHMADLIRAVDHFIDHPDAQGPFNITAPEPVRQGDFARRLARHLHRPAVMPAPAAMMRLMLGECADTLLSSQRVIPRRLQESGFSFQFPDVDSALADIVRPH